MRLLVAVDHRLADGAVRADVARERLVVVVVHAVTRHVVLQWRAERTAVAPEQSLVAVVHAQVIPELQLGTIYTPPSLYAPFVSQTGSNTLEMLQDREMQSDDEHCQVTTTTTVL